MRRRSSTKASSSRRSAAKPGSSSISAADPTEERSINYYILGAEWKPVAGPGQALVEVNAFSTRLTDIFHVIQKDDSATECSSSSRRMWGGARVYGLEVNLGSGIGDDFIIQGGLVEQRARLDDAEPDFGSRDSSAAPAGTAT